MRVRSLDALFQANVEFLGELAQAIEVQRTTPKEEYAAEPDRNHHVCQTVGSTSNLIAASDSLHSPSLLAGDHAENDRNERQD